MKKVNIILIVILFISSCRNEERYNFDYTEYPQKIEYDGGIIYDFTDRRIIENDQEIEDRKEYLELIEESDILKGISQDTISYYRFTITPDNCEEFVKASILRKKDNAVLYSYKRYSYRQNKIVEEITVQLPSDRMNEFELLIKKCDFWSLTNFRSLIIKPYQHSEKWTIEGFITMKEFQNDDSKLKSEYIKVERYKPVTKSSCFFEVAEYLMNLSNSKFKRKDCLWE